MDNLTFIHGEPLTHLIEWQNTGLKTALITLINVDGRSPYPVGTQMGVAENGDYCGYLTSGCAEKAIIQHALLAIKSQVTAVQRYGKGSPYFDIVLPCGSGIDVFIDPLIPLELLTQLQDKRNCRQPIWLNTLVKGTHTPQQASEQEVHYPLKSHNRLFENVLNPPSSPYPLKQSSLVGNQFWRYYPPTPKLIIAGQGPIVAALSQFAVQADFTVEAYFDDPQSAPHLNHRKLAVFPLQQLSQGTFSASDEHTAFVSLLHEHDKESQFLVPALKSSLFYIGALGSRATHSTRCDLLSAMGIDKQTIAKIHGPIGFPLKAKTPIEIAVSILSEIISVKNKRLGQYTKKLTTSLAASS